MFKKITELSFVIGSFFTVLSVILFGDLLIDGRNDNLSIYTAAAFLIFGVAMIIGSYTSHKK